MNEGLGYGFTGRPTRLTSKDRVVCPVKRRAKGRVVIVVLPRALCDQAFRIRQVLDWLLDVSSNVSLDHQHERVYACCGNEIEDAEARTIWDVIAAAADREGLMLNMHGILSKGDER